MRIVDEWSQDLRFAVRQCRRAPGFVTATALTLALGIGAATAIFTVVNGVLLRALPYPDPDRIVQVWELNRRNTQMQVADPNFDDLREQVHSFADLAEIGTDNAASVSGDIEATRGVVTFVSHDFFDALGVPPLFGRTFAPEEEKEGGPRAVVLSYGFWQRAFGGARDVLGKRLHVEDGEYTIVGVMRPTLTFPDNTDLWGSLEIFGRSTSRTAHNSRVVGRLRPGVPLGSARREATALAHALAARYGSETTMADVAIVPLRDEMTGGIREMLLVLLAASAVLLGIACTNAANLIVARLTTRRGELAIRLALGAARSRLVRQCLAESLLIALGGGVIGLGLAALGTSALKALDPGHLPRAGDIRVDASVLAFAVVVALSTALGLALLSAWRATRGDLKAALSASDRTMSGAGSSVGTRRALVVAQVAMTLVLLVAAGLLGRTFVNLLRVNPGFRTERAVVLDISVGAADSVAEVQRGAFYHELLGRLGAIPGVTSVGAINAIPLDASGMADGNYIALTSPADVTTHRYSGQADFLVASGGYFTAMHIPLLDGRVFDDRDTPTTTNVALVSASFAAQQWPGQSALGRWIQYGNMDGDYQPFEIIGVVGDVRVDGLGVKPRPTFYAYYLQRPAATHSRINFVLSGPADPSLIAHAALATVRALRPDVPPRVRTIETIVASSVAGQRFLLLLVGVFGAVALTLAALGLYSVISYLVTQRARELSIRVALGARSGDIQSLVLRQGGVLALVGIALGALVAVGATRLLAGLLYGVGTLDPVSFVAVAAVVAAVAIAACWLPARRASRTKVAEVLRS
jgi:putative ABC transport system permease protein